MRPTFSRFDIHDLFDTLPSFVRHPMALATMASVLAHGVIAVGLPVFAGSEEKKPERVVDVISLSPAEQGKLPSNSLMMPGGGLNGTAALPLPLTKNGTLSPLSGLSGSTLGSSGSPYSGVPGLLDPPIISYNQTSPPRPNSDSIFKTTKTKKTITGYTDTTAIDIAELIQKRQPEEKPTDPTANRDSTLGPPGAIATNLPKVEPNKEVPENPTKPIDGTMPESGPNPQQSNPSTQNQQLQPPNAQLPTAAIALGEPNFGEATNEVNMASPGGIVTFSSKSDYYTSMLKQVAQQTNPTWNENDVLDTETIHRPLLLELPALPIPKTSDAITRPPLAPEFILLVTRQGTIYLDRNQQGNVVFNPVFLRRTGYTNLDSQAINYMRTQLPAIQTLVAEQVLANNPPTKDNKDKYRYLRVRFKPTSATATG
jgi:hypothetical protein